MTNTQTSECPDSEFHGKPFRYCSCGWIEPQETFKGVCTYEIQNFVFDKTREEFQAAIKSELHYGSVDMLKYFMDEYDKRKTAKLEP